MLSHGLPVEVAVAVVEAAVVGGGAATVLSGGRRRVAPATAVKLSVKQLSAAMADGAARDTPARLPPLQR